MDLNPRHMVESLGGDPCVAGDVVPALKKLRGKDGKFKASLGYIGRASNKTKITRGCTQLASVMPKSNGRASAVGLELDLLLPLFF